MTQDLFGTCLRWPFRVTEAGGLALVSGYAALWQAIDVILSTPLGTRPLDPTFGVPPVVLEPFGAAEVIALAIGRAIERSEPRIKDIRVDILSDDAQTGTLRLKVWLTPIGSSVPLNRIFPLYRSA